MKTLSLIVPIFLGLADSSLLQAQDKPTPPPARVKLCGTLLRFNSASVPQPDGKIAAVTVVVVKLADGLEIEVQTPKQVAQAELLDLLKRSLEKGVVAEGVLKQDGKKLVLAGEPRPRDVSGKDKDLAKGTTIVEGEAIQGKYKFNKTEESSLAIKNGSAVIVVAGNLTKEQGELQGAIRITGKLRIDDKSTISVVPEKIEAVKKQ